MATPQRCLAMTTTFFCVSCAQAAAASPLLLAVVVTDVEDEEATLVESLLNVTPSISPHLI